MQVADDGRLTSDFDTLPMDHSGLLTTLGDVTVKLRGLSIEQIAGLSAESADRSASLIKIRIAGARTDRALSTSQLVQRRYAERGYALPPAIDDPHLYTVAAFEEGQLTGTVGVRLESERGLCAEDLYQAEIAALRADRLRLCEFTRLAVDANALSHTVLASLFHTAYLYAHRLKGIDAAVIEVNPRHVPFYIRALDFRRIGPERHQPRVGAPAVLLAARFSQISEGIARFAGRPELAATTRTLYPFGFSAQEEEGILNRLRQQDARRSGAPALA